jgi:hypothetical protein
MEFEYRVVPVNIPPPEVELKKEPVSFAGPIWTGVVALFVFGGIADGIQKSLNLSHDEMQASTGPAMAACAVAALLAAGLVLTALKRRALRKAQADQRYWQERIDNDNRKKAEFEATATTTRLRDLLSGSYAAAAAIPKKLERACTAIERAELECDQKAYGPFWDATELAAELLSEILDHFRSIQKNAADYARELHGRNHNFPPFPVAIEALPNPAGVAAAVRLMVRRGQTNFEFATIWEHRKTRRVLVGGFHTIGDAITGAADALCEAYGDLGRSVSSSLDGMDMHIVETVRHTERVAELQNRLLKQLRRE